MSVNTSPLRRIAADLGWAGHGGENAWSYERLVDRAVADYWRHRIVHGPLCGTVAGFDAHGNTPTCQPCRAAEQVAVWQRRAAA